LYDSAGNQVLRVNPKIAQAYPGGIAVGVSAGATIDSVTFTDAGELSPLEGTSQTSAANSYFQSVCPDGQVMTGAQGMQGDAIDSITAIHCGRIVRDAAHASGYHIQATSDIAGGGGGGGASAWNDVCSNDGFVTGITVGVAPFDGYTSMYGIQLW